MDDIKVIDDVPRSAKLIIDGEVIDVTLIHQSTQIDDCRGPYLNIPLGTTTTTTYVCTHKKHNFGGNKNDKDQTK